MSNDVVVVPPQQGAMGGGLEGAERTSRETALWGAPVISPDRQINPVKEEADARSRDSVQNDGLALGAVQTHRDSIVGTNFRLNATPNWELLGATEAWAEEFQLWAESSFNLMADSPENWFDASRQNTFTGIIRLAVASHIMSGEVLQSVEWIRQQQRPFSTAIQTISPTRLSNPDWEQDSQTLSRGVKKDFWGEAIGYHIRNSFPNDYFLNDFVSARWKYVEARKPWGRRQIIHIMEPLQPEQTRGISDMVSALKDMRMTKKFKDVTLQNAVVNATYAAAIETELPQEFIFAQMGAGGNGFMNSLQAYMNGLAAYLDTSKNIALDGVKMPHLYPGTKLNMKPLGTPGGIGTGFEESLQRHIAAAFGLSYEEFSRDFTKTNYSSARASMGQTWRYMQNKKKNVADRDATMIYILWLEEQVNAGRAPMPKGKGVEIFYDPLLREALCSCEWIGSSRGQIDELKETQAAILRIKSGLSTYEKEAARLGEDYRKIFAQRAREEGLIKKLGLVFSDGAKKPGANDAAQTMNESDDEGDGKKKPKAEEIGPVEQAQINALNANAERAKAEAESIRKPKVERQSAAEKKRLELTEKIVASFDRPAHERAQ